MKLSNLKKLTIKNVQRQHLTYSPETCAELGIKFEGEENEYWEDLPVEITGETVVDDIVLMNEKYMAGNLLDLVFHFEDNFRAIVVGMEMDSFTRKYRFTLVFKILNELDFKSLESLTNLCRNTPGSELLVLNNRVMAQR